MRVRAQVIVLVAAAALLTACNQPSSSTGASADKSGGPSAPAPVDPATAAKLAALPAPYNTADIANGQSKFVLCRSCHTLAQGGANMTGPNLYGVIGRTAGTVEKFNYSQPVKTAGFAWDGEHLDKWLADPRGFLPGNRMSFVGVKDPKDRTDLIAYLMIETGHKPGG